jgi:hypothetical protein
VGVRGRASYSARYFPAKRSSSASCSASRSSTPAISEGFAQTEPQSTPEQNPAWELLLSNGSVHPTGAQRDQVARGNLTAAQISYVPRAALAITATLGWARSRDIATADDPKLDIFMYDLGAELRAPRWSAGAVSLRPFAGLGAGARSYNYRSLHVDATHNLAGYGSVGAELGVKRVRLRLEARDYVAGFKPLDGQGAASTRNDVALLVGLRIAR